MTSLQELTASRPTRSLDDQEILLVQGEGGGDFYILMSGRLSVIRDGVSIATIDQPGTLVGEMSVLRGTPYSATVRADGPAKVRVVRDANKLLDSEPGLARRVAALVAGRLDATSALLAELAKQNKGKPSEQGLLNRIFASLYTPAASDRDG
jgi:CRP-like cAMP-binding protein